jgi:hypothetical protein
MFFPTVLKEKLKSATAAEITRIISVRKGKTDAQGKGCSQEKQVSEERESV